MPDGSEQERITDSSFEIISSKETPIPQVLKNQLYGGSAQGKRHHGAQTRHPAVSGMGVLRAVGA